MILEPSKRKKNFLQTNGIDVMYLALNLHYRPHGSEDAKLILLHNFFFKRQHIDHTTISPILTGTCGERSANNIFVSYLSSHHLIQLDHTLPGGIISLKHDQTTHLLLGGRKDHLRTNGKIIQNEFLWKIDHSFGYSWIEKHLNPKT